MSARLKPRSRPVKPLPPGGRQLLDAVRSGRATNTFICASNDSWNQHRKRLDRVVLPPGESPDLYDWTIFKDQSPVILAADSEQERIKRLIALLLHAQAAVVCVIFIENGITHCRHFRNEK